MSNTHKRRKAQLRGRRGEFWARQLLRMKGYRILARDYRVPVGEIDVIAKRGRLLAFVEVKSHQSYRHCLEALTRRQCRRIERAASAYLAANPTLRPENYVLISSQWFPGAGPGI